MASAESMSRPYRFDQTRAVNATSAGVIHAGVSDKDGNGELRMIRGPDMEEATPLFLAWNWSLISRREQSSNIHSSHQGATNQLSDAVSRREVEEIFELRRFPFLFAADAAESLDEEFIENRRGRASP